MEAGTNNIIYRIREELLDHASKGTPLAIPTRLIAPLSKGSRGCVIRERFNDCSELIVFCRNGGRLSARLRVKWHGCDNVLEKWANIVESGPFHVRADSGFLEARAEGIYTSLLVEAARKEMLNVDTARFQAHSTRRAIYLIIAMAGIVYAYQEYGGPVRRSDGISRAISLFGLRLSRSAWYELVSKLVDGGAVRKVYEDKSRRVAPNTRSDIYHSAVLILTRLLGRLY